MQLLCNGTAALGGLPLRLCRNGMTIAYLYIQCAPEKDIFPVRL